MPRQPRVSPRSRWVAAAEEKARARGQAGALSACCTTLLNCIAPGGFTVTRVSLLRSFLPPDAVFAVFLPSLFTSWYCSRIEKTFYSSANALSCSYLLLIHLPIKPPLINLLIWHILKNAINLPFTLPCHIMNKAAETPRPTPALGILQFIIALCWHFFSPFSVSLSLLPAWYKLISPISSWGIT